MKKIKWGIIGCGNVTELKSGPAFNKVNNSELVAVMRRDALKAQDYAFRHQVPRWYDDADQLINDDEVNAVYIATPPSTHEKYCLDVLKAGKDVYVEKPMALNYVQACNMANTAAQLKLKLVVAHYRREQPFFKKIKQLLDDKAIADVRYARIEYHKSGVNNEGLYVPRTDWRVNPLISGGGLFHDLAPHQLDLMIHFFGPVEKATGIATNQAGNYQADDMVAGNILFKNGIVFNGNWCFNTELASDICEITGTAGKISFKVFDGRVITVTSKESSTEFTFELLQHVQQPMIEAVVKYFSGEGPNPCSAFEAAETMGLIDHFVMQ